MKLSYLLLSLCVVAAASQAAEEVAPLVVTQPSGANAVEVVPYRYGMKLDIGKVISIQEPTELSCDVVTATMLYEDSRDMRRALSYLKIPASCSNWG